eukprot:2410360-Amphidinium_carterae.1
MALSMKWLYVYILGRVRKGASKGKRHLEPKRGSKGGQAWAAERVKRELIQVIVGSGQNLTRS